MTQSKINSGLDSPSSWGRTTISPPSKVETEFSAYQVLASGIDKLVLAIDIEWKSPAFFNDLADAKQNAIEENHEVAFSMPLFTESLNWKCRIKPHGSNGFEWLVLGKDFSLRIGNWMKPKTRPSMMVEIHSETLWRIGPKESVETISQLIKCYGGQIVAIKPSRLDLCVDMLFPANEWNETIQKRMVSRAINKGLFFENDTLTGFSIGRGDISARLYDKKLEIEQKSKKFWMYEIWDIEKVPDSFRMIRVEFQLRREVLKELGIILIDNLFKSVKGIWAYCSSNWLTFKNNPGQHHTQRSILPWWDAVQNGFGKIQDGLALVRTKAFQADEKQLFSQAYGMVSSLKALLLERSDDMNNQEQSLFSALLDIENMAAGYGKTNDEFNKDIEYKRSKYQRFKDKLKNIYPPGTPPNANHRLQFDGGTR